jgi:hypothetical protein
MNMKEPELEISDTETIDEHKGNQSERQANSSHVSTPRSHKHSFPKQLETIIKAQLKLMQPQWFITVQWTPPARDFQTAVYHSKHFRNKLLTHLYECKLKQIPEASHRCKMIWFHEKAPDARGRVLFHSHLHMSRLPAPYVTVSDLKLLLITRIKPGFQSLQHLFRTKNPSVVIKPWIDSHHASYNFKDYYRFRHHQDADLTLDIQNSDLIFTK